MHTNESRIQSDYSIEYELLPLECRDDTQNVGLRVDTV